ncbi:four-carbon acid sugar kinase family protein [Labrys sp. LIt4]|uniref:four-carbon acid sugar kinase family protein n=1 Tax=Labrys sp. LIt4 TaxID=2821355 RepID=UPI001ADF0003|nr:four-carbon acid sugar kinase family protein [Labrys sp. LIt4]MBP0580429.1 four-carbon acid sugar kinase family protein [Labrys sp. LIt4]
MSGLLLSYYGDDFTGSTDVMEALASHGVRTALFLQPPTSAQRERLGACDAIGLAGTSRSQGPAWMDAELTPAFEWLKQLGAATCHYKVCSTFDSSPTIGNIGRAIEIGSKVFRQRQVPLVVGAPQLRRYTSFGTLFAAYQGEVYRIDRHPVMSRHPVTPMDEADLRLHLARQTRSSIGLVDIAALAAVDADGIIDAVLAKGEDIVLLDVNDDATQLRAGRQLLRLQSRLGPFVAGSSGVEYALLRAWQETGLVGGKASFAAPGIADRIAVVSGSCSPTTERQIRHATANGFDGVALDPRALIRGGEAAIAEAIATGLASLGQGRSVILYTALGPSTDIGDGFENEGDRNRIGVALGRIQKALVERAGLRRAVIAGGDTSSHALRELGIFALTTRLPLPSCPGSPLCTAYAATPAFDGLEIALKGGQVGGDDYFSMIRDGRASA